MAKLTLNDLASLTNEQSAITLINANNALIETAMENTLSRDGTSPNSIDEDLDMDSHHILNLPQPLTASEPLRYSDLSDFVGGGTVSNIPVGGGTGDVLAKDSADDYDVEWITNSDLITAGTNISKSGTSPVTIATSASPTFATSTTTPQIYGGTAAGSTLDIRGTSNVSPSGDTTTIRGSSITLRANAGGTTTVNIGVAASTDGTLVLAGSSSGSTILKPTAAASGTVTLPAATDTLVGKATTDTFTNKTYDTAGSGNSFSINGVAVTANTGTGSVVRATSPTLVTPVLGAATATSINGIIINASTGTLTLNTNTLAVSGTAISLILAGPSGTMTFQGTDTYVGRATTDTLTNKTFNTAGTGNVFQINSNTVSSVTGSGAVAVLQTSPTLITPNVGANGSSTGVITLSGVTSGSCTLKVADVAGTAINFRIPTTNGTSGHFLQTDGSGNTSWTAGGGATTSGNRTLIATLTANNTATTLADTTSLTSSFNQYELVIQNLLPATTANTLRLRVTVGSLQTSGYHSTVINGVAGDTATTGILLSGTTNLISSTGTGYSGIVYVSAPSGSAFPKLFTGHGGYYSGTLTFPANFAGQFDTNNDPVTGISFDFTGGGNLFSGTVKIYGIVN